jgi:hypothetical protein
VQVPATHSRPKPEQPHVWPQPLSTPHCGQLGVHPHWPAVPPPPQVWGDVQDPQVTVAPQPLGAVPQFCPAAHACMAVSGVQPHTLATLGVAPAHVCGGVHDPQLIVPPQPLETVPQFFSVQATCFDRGVQPHTLAMLGAPPAHV